MAGDTEIAQITAQAGGDIFVAGTAGSTKIWIACAALAYADLAPARVRELIAALGLAIDIAEPDPRPGIAAKLTTQVVDEIIAAEPSRAATLRCSPSWCPKARRG
jgi:hypothetical protein